MDKKLLIILALVSLLILPSVVALGITPARTTIDFSPGLQKEVSVSIINSENKDMSLVIYVQGELNQSILLSENSFEMSASEKSRQFNFIISLPDSLPPGLRTAEVVVLNLPKSSGTSEAFIGAAVGVITQVYVHVPYPGKYAEAALNIINAEVDGEAIFVIPVINRGDLDLVSVKANVDIYNKLNEKVGSFNTDEISILSGERKEIVYKWKADVPIGIYRAVVTLIYDTETIQLEKQFNVGSADLDLQQIEIRDFSLGEIAKFEMLVENKWSEPIIGVYSQTNVFNEEGKIMADFKSPTYNIDPLTKIVMTSYWDTGGVSKGIYDASVYLKYGEKSSQKDMKLEISDNEINVIGLGYVISEKTKSKSGNSSLVTILIVAIVVLVMINLLWFLFLRRKLKR